MNLDLHRALGRLAEGGTPRTAPTDQLLARVRRRRAARAVIAGAVSMGTVAAVAVGAMAVNGRAPFADPATVDDPTATPTEAPSTLEPPTDAEPVPSGVALNCGDWAPDPLVGEVDGVSLAVEIPDAWQEDDMFVLPGQVAATGAAELPEHALMVALLSDGTVRASGGTIVGLETDEGRLPVGTPFTAEILIEPCGEQRLPAGEYTAVASLLYDVGDGRSGILQVAAPITVTEWTTDPAAEAAAEAAVAAIVAAAQSSVGGAPGTCGTTLTAGTLIDDSIRVGLSMTFQPARPRPLSFYGHSFVDNFGSRTIQLLVEDVDIVLTRDGIVVANGATTGSQSSTDPEPLEMEPDSGWGLTQAFWFRVCALPGSAAPDVPLPAGDYQAWVVLSGTVTDVNGPAAGSTREVTVLGEPVDVTFS